VELVAGAGGVGLVPAVVVTVTMGLALVSGVNGGEVAVIDVAELTVKLVAFVAPNLTSVTLVKLVPLIVTAVPPVGGPMEFSSPVTVGGSAARAGPATAKDKTATGTATTTGSPEWRRRRPHCSAS
jgi:hypothetical protein